MSNLADHIDTVPLKVTSVASDDGGLVIEKYNDNYFIVSKKEKSEELNELVLLPACATKNSIIHQTPLIEVNVMSEPVEQKTQIQQDDFVQKVIELFKTSKKPWRKIAGLAEYFKVDIKELSDFLDGNSNFARKVSKTEPGVVYYSLLVEENKDKNDKVSDLSEKEVPLKRKLHSVKDFYALALLRQNFVNLNKIVDTYAARLHEKNSDIFAHVTKANHHLHAAVALLGSILGADDKDLPN